jgi:hypothetical protein
VWSPNTYNLINSIVMSKRIRWSKRVGRQRLWRFIFFWLPWMTF